MAYNFRVKRVAYDNVAAQSISGVERLLPPNGQTVTDPSLYNPDSVSVQGSARETGSISNIVIGSSGGIEDTENASADKLTSDSDDISDAG